MQHRYYIVKNGVQKGPVSYESLLKANIQGSAAIWTPGLANWVTVENIEEFKAKFGKAIDFNDMPPPVSNYAPPGSSYAPPIATQTPIPPETQSKPEFSSGIYTRSKLNDEAPSYRKTTVMPQSNSSTASVEFIPDAASSAELQPASILKRLGALVINWIPGFLVIIVAPKGDSAIYIYWAFTFLSPLVSYYFFSGNLGHLALGMKVVNMATGEDFRNPILGALREFMKGMMYWFVLPVIWLLWDKNRQNIYDKIFGTIVIDK